MSRSGRTRDDAERRERHFGGLLRRGGALHPRMAALFCTLVAGASRAVIRAGRLEPSPSGGTGPPVGVLT